MPGRGGRAARPQRRRQDHRAACPGRTAADRRGRIDARRTWCSTIRHHVFVAAGAPPGRRGVPGLSAVPPPDGAGERGLRPAGPGHVRRRRAAGGGVAGRVGLGRVRRRRPARCRAARRNVSRSPGPWPPSHAAAARRTARRAGRRHPRRRAPRPPRHLDGFDGCDRARHPRPRRRARAGRPGRHPRGRRVSRRARWPRSPPGHGPVTSQIWWASTCSPAVHRRVVSPRAVARSSWPTRREGRAFAAIRPQSVSLHRSHPEGSHRNVWQSTVATSIASTTGCGCG